MQKNLRTVWSSRGMDGCQNSCKNLYLGVSHTRGYCNWEWVISLCTVYWSLENIKIPPWGLGLLQGGSRSKAVGNSAALPLFLNSQNYFVSVLASSYNNTFPEALVIFTGITEIFPPVVRSGQLHGHCSRCPPFSITSCPHISNGFATLSNEWETPGHPAPFCLCDCPGGSSWMQVHRHHQWRWAKDFLPR